MRPDFTNLQFLILKKEDCAGYGFALVIAVAVLDIEVQYCTCICGGMH